MSADIPDPDFEPEWLWGTRVTAEAARVATEKGRTPQERFHVYEQLILSACEERQRRESPEPNGLISEPTASTRHNLLYNCIKIEDSIIISGFEAADTN
jgi:hypothetical protein